MSEKLTNQTQSNSAYSPLTRRQNQKFKVAICDNLEKKFDFKSLRPESIKEFHKFIEETVGKDLTITEVDQLFLRTKGKPVEVRRVHGERRDIIHYGKNQKPFRIFGYYNVDGYFTLTRIDPNHKTHK